MSKLSCYPQLYRWIFLITFLFVVSSKASAQFYAIKVDALGLCATTLNVEASMVIRNQWSIHLPIKVNPWTFGDKKYQHATLMPGVRYWFIDSYSRGWFLGVNAVLTAYDHEGLVGSKVDYFARNYRYKGFGYGGGVSAGYSFPVSKRWNVEFEAGIASVYVDHDIYHETEAGERVGYQKGFLPIPGKIGINLVYLF